MDLFGKMTLGKLSEQLQEHLKKFKDELGIEDDEDKGSRIHPYGPINTFGELGDIHQIMNGMKLRCDQLKSSGNSCLGVLKASLESHQHEDIASPWKNCLKDTIEKLRNATQDLTLKAVLQKLQAISEETGLKFDHGGQTGTDCFISSDMFYFEVKLDTCGSILDVREQLHSGEPKSCQELADILRNRNYEEFKHRLKGLADLYRIKVDTFMKSSKIFAALEAVERDILKLCTALEGTSSKPFDILNNGPVGFIFKRQGGQLMQVSYFGNPVELANIEAKESFLQDGVSRELGLSAEIAVESARTNRLPTSSLVYVDDLKRARYENLDNNNSEELPASLVMRLKKPFVLSAQNLSEIHAIISQSCNFLENMIALDTSTAFRHMENISICNVVGDNPPDQFVHASEASLDNLVLKQELELKHRDEWIKKPFLVTLPDEDHVYRISPSDSLANIGFIIARLPFQHPSQVPSIIKVLRRQAVYNLLLLSCAGKLNALSSNEKSEYFDVQALNGNTIEISLLHPLHTSLCSVRFSVQADKSVKTILITAEGAPVFCSSSYMDKIVNRCLSIPITMRCILRKASTYVPVSAPPQSTAKPTTTKDGVPRPKQLKLLIPSFSMDNSMTAPLVSPGILPTFSLTSESPGSSSFTFPASDLVSTLPGGYTKPAFSSPKKLNSSPGKPSTPGTPKSRPFKLPKITIKRKRDGDEYEIDKEKSNFDVLEESEAQTIAESLVDGSKQGFGLPGAATKSDDLQMHLDNKQQGTANNLAFTTNNMPFDLSVDALSSNAISINTVGELEGLLGPSIDVSTLMGGGLVTQLGITSSTFPEGFSAISNSAGVGESQVEAFDLDAISGGSNINFGVDDSLSGVSGAAIDPSMVVSSTSSLANTPVFDVHQSLIDIDSFIMGANPDEGAKTSVNQPSMGGE